MLVRWLFAWMHLLGLGIGLGAVWARARALRGPLDAAGLRRVFYADAWWGVAALVWIGTGLVRVFAGLEKGTEYYLLSHLFWTKLALMGLAGVNAGIIHLVTHRAGGRGWDSRAAKFAGVASIVLWAGVLITGRLVAYEWWTTEYIPGFIETE